MVKNVEVAKLLGLTSYRIHIFFPETELFLILVVSINFGTVKNMRWQNMLFSRNKSTNHSTKKRAKTKLIDQASFEALFTVNKALLDFTDISDINTFKGS